MTQITDKVFNKRNEMIALAYEVVMFKENFKYHEKDIFACGRLFDIYTFATNQPMSGFGYILNLNLDSVPHHHYEFFKHDLNQIDLLKVKALSDRMYNDIIDTHGFNKDNIFKNINDNVRENQVICLRTFYLLLKRIDNINSYRSKDAETFCSEDTMIMRIMAYCYILTLLLSEIPYFYNFLGNRCFFNRAYGYVDVSYKIHYVDYFLSRDYKDLADYSYFPKKMDSNIFDIYVRDFFRLDNKDKIHIHFTQEHIKSFNELRYELESKILGVSH